NELVLDEPTNDLDLETLELLEEQLVEWPGTLLLVSHDRVFLDNVITSTLSFEGDGGVREYVGGYTDWVRQSSQSRPQQSSQSRPQRATQAAKEEATEDRDGVSASASSVALHSLSQPRRRRLSYKEQRELDALPLRIEALETEQRELHATIAGP